MEEPTYLEVLKAWRRSCVARWWRCQFAQDANLCAAAIGVTHSGEKGVGVSSVFPRSVFLPKSSLPTPFQGKSATSLQGPSARGVPLFPQAGGTCTKAELSSSHPCPLIGLVSLLSPKVCPVTVGEVSTLQSFPPLIYPQQTWLPFSSDPLTWVTNVN